MTGPGEGNRRNKNARQGEIIDGDYISMVGKEYFRIVLCSHVAWLELME